VRLLLDTHALLWWLADDARLAEVARKAIADPTNDAFVSAASAWEIAIKVRLGKVTMPDDLAEQLAANSFTALPVQVPHALAVRRLPDHHRDPFDRLLVAQAQIERLTVVTADETIPRYDVAVLRADTISA
jgi:PIN domain nuclease of toxin-antitoxin system